METSSHIYGSRLSPLKSNTFSLAGAGGTGSSTGGNSVGKGGAP